MPLCFNNSSGHLVLNIALIIAAGIYIFISSRSFSNPFSDLQRIVNTPHLPRTTEFPVDELELVLEKAAAGNNKTVIIVMVNKAYVEEVGGGRGMLDIFLESFWEGEDTLPLLDHLLVVATDQTAYDRCLFKRLHCYKMEMEGVVDSEKEKVYMSHSFIEMMWQRTGLLLDILHRGYHLVFTDTDVMWLRNPLSRLSMNGSVDMEISVDRMRVKAEKNYLINTGFYHVRSNQKTISLFKKWYDMRLKSTGEKEQDVLQKLLDSGFSDKLGLTLGFLSTTQFSGFCQNSNDMGAVTTIHANCCRHIPAKVSDLTLALGDWKRYKASHVNNKWSLHAKCRASWKDNHYTPNP